MKRIQLFEFEDFGWFPSAIRTGMTNLIVVLHKMMGTSVVIANLIENIKKRYDFTQIVDLGSGSGGAMLDVMQEFKNKPETKNIKLIMTDLHPNPQVVSRIKNKGDENIDYDKTSVDATNFSKMPKGLKTMMNSFHHMPPDIARKILKSAHDNKQPIMIYEMGENFVPTLLWWLLLPLSLVILIVMVLFMTPFVRPLTWKQLLFTYIIPVIPLCYAWDGQASSVRTYTFKDVEFLLEGLKDEGYTWEIAHAKKANGKNLGYYVLGLPV